MTLDEQFLEWELSVPKEIKTDALWHATAYRMSLFISDRYTTDLERLKRHPQTGELANQLARALASISANYAEGYSRTTIGDRTRFYEYSLGSAREARDWCFKLRHTLGDECSGQLLTFLTRIIQLLTVTIVRERARAVRQPRRKTGRDT